MKERLKQLQQAMDQAGTSTADDAGSTKHSSVSDTLTSQACCNIPVRPMWTQQDTLLIFSPPGLCASNKVFYHNKPCLPAVDYIVK